MSRIGKKPVPVGKAKVAVKGQKINVEGPKGKLELDVHPTITVKLEGTDLVVTRPDDEKFSKALHGLTRSLLSNMIEGVTTATRRRLKYRASATRPSRRARPSSCPSATPTRSSSRSRAT